MEFRCDFHLHTCLSPCADNEMTPNNIVNMARILNLDVIAITDHNSALNCRSVMEAANGTGLTVLPGVELSTSEEIHVVCLFPDCSSAEAFGAMVCDTLMPIKNRPESFGEQIFMNKNDEIMGKEEILLTTASKISIDFLPSLLGGYGGVFWPAHVDRTSYSIISVLGDIRNDMGFSFVEITRNADKKYLQEKYSAVREMRLIVCSDAHNLESMVMQEYEVLTFANREPQTILNHLKTCL